MVNSAKIFAYCERGLDPAFWAEPLNATTNIGFIIAAAFCLRALIKRPAEEGKLFRYFLILVLFTIGIGSFLFHTFATPWAASADVIPIGIFMFAYLGYALYRFVGMPLILVAGCLALFFYSVDKAMELQCYGGQIGFELVATRNAARCLNGSAGYLPALACMLLIGGWLALRRHAAAPYLLGAACVFTVSIGFRAMDRIWCRDVLFYGNDVGTHFLWHMLNSLTLFLLIIAAIRHGHRPAVRDNALPTV